MKLATGKDLENGTPAGKAGLCVFKGGNQLTGCMLYDSLEEALYDMPKQLLAINGTKAIVNYKSPDESYLHAFKLESAIFPKQKPLSETVVGWVDSVIGFFQK